MRETPVHMTWGRPGSLIDIITSCADFQRCEELAVWPPLQVVNDRLSRLVGRTRCGGTVTWTAIELSHADWQACVSEHCTGSITDDTHAHWDAWATHYHQQDQ